MTKTQLALIARYARHGRRGFYVVRSAEAPRAGEVVADPTRFRPPVRALEGDGEGVPDAR